MKLSKIKGALKGKKICIVTEEGGNQWLGDGAAFYLMDSGLDLTKGNVLAILDIDEEQRGNYTVTEPDVTHLPMLDMCPQEECDKLLTPLVSVSWAGELITIMKTEDDEAVAVSQKRIAPADGKEPLGFFLRRSVDEETGEIKPPVVAAFRDMLCCAVMMPVRKGVMDEIWRVMRMASAESLAYCEEGESEG